MLRLGISALLALVFWVPQLHAAVTIPLRVRFTGVLFITNDEGRKGALDNLEMLIGKEKRIFLLEKMKIVGSVGLNRAILQRLFPPLLRLRGPDELIRRLKTPELIGNVVTLEGFLYVDSRMFSLTEVDEGEAAGIK